GIQSLRRGRSLTLSYRKRGRGKRQAIASAFFGGRKKEWGRGERFFRLLELKHWLVGSLRDCSDETIAASMVRLDNCLLGPVIVHGLAGGHDAAGERGLADDLPRPEFLQQFVFGDYAVAMMQEVNEDIEDLGLNADRLVCIAQLIQARVELKAREAVDHSSPRALQISGSGVVESRRRGHSLARRGTDDYPEQSRLPDAFSAPLDTVSRCFCFLPRG